VWKTRGRRNKRIVKFFRIGLSHNSLANYYTLNFALMQHHKYSLTELENMIPFERDLYVQMLMDFIKQETEKNNGRSQ